MINEKIHSNNATDNIIRLIEQGSSNISQYIKRASLSNINMASIKKALYIKSKEYSGSNKEQIYLLGISLTSANFIDSMKKLDSFFYKQAKPEDTRTSKEVTVTTENPLQIDISSVEAIELYLKHNFVYSKRTNPKKYTVYLENKNEYFKHKDALMLCKSGLSKFSVQMSITLLNNFNYLEKMNEDEKKNLRKFLEWY